MSVAYWGDQNSFDPSALERVFINMNALFGSSRLRLMKLPAVIDCKEVDG